jgi:ABC-type sulfate transport system permease subunit
VFEKQLKHLMKETDQKYTDKQLLVKGIKRMVLSIPLIVLTTYILTFAFLNKETIPLYVLLPLGIISMGVTIYLIFKGLKLILKAVF